MLNINRQKEAANLHYLYEVDSNTNNIQPNEIDRVKRMILSNNYWIENDYADFLKHRDMSEYIAFFTPYTPQELKEHGVRTYRLKGYNIGFALAPQRNGDVDIISVFNNEPNIRGIINYLMEAAIQKGGNTLDHYDTKLSDLYVKNGFMEYDRVKWDDRYAHPKWDYEKYNRPDVVFRRINPELRKSLNLTERIFKY